MINKNLRKGKVRRALEALGATALLGLGGCAQLHNVAPLIPGHALPKTTLTTSRNGLRAAKLENTADRFYCLLGRKESIVDGDTVYTTLRKYDDVARKFGVNPEFHRPLVAHRLRVDLPDGSTKWFYSDYENKIDLGKHGTLDVGRGPEAVRADLKRIFGPETALNISPSEHNEEGVNWGVLSYFDLRTSNRGTIALPVKATEVAARAGLGNEGRYAAVVRTRGGKTFVLFTKIEEMLYGTDAGKLLEHKDVVLGLGQRTDLEEFPALLGRLAGIAADAAKISNSLTSIVKDQDYMKSRD